MSYTVLFLVVLEQHLRYSQRFQARNHHFCLPGAINHLAYGTWFYVKRLRKGVYGQAMKPEIRP